VGTLEILGSYMLHRLFIFVVIFASMQPCFGQASSPVRVTIFRGVNSGCDGTALDPSVPVDAGSWPLGSLAGPSFCIFNTGSTPVTLSNIVVTGTDFSGGGDVLPFVLQPNSANFDVTGAGFKATATGTRTGQISFVDDATGSPQTFQLIGTGIADFGITFTTPANLAATVNAGFTAHYDLEVLAASTFTGTVTILCGGGLPAGTTCSVTPSTLPLNTNGVGPQFEVAITTTAASASLRPLHPHFGWAFATVFCIMMASRRKRQRLLFLFVMPALLFGILSCSGGSHTQPGSGPPGPTPAGTYTIPITASSNGISHTRTLTLVVK
jgi:hypothetical protein